MPAHEQVYVNGEWLPRAEAAISVFDHGFLYGDGVFEGIRVYGGRIFRLPQHLQRLRKSAQAIQLEIPFTDDEVTVLLIDACKRNDIVDGYIRLVVSRGIGDLGLDPRKCSAPSVVIIASRIALYPEAAKREGIKIVTASIRRIGPDQLDPRIKSLNYLNNALARLEANHAGCDEALMLNSAGYVAECTVDNIFIVQSRVVSTPTVHAGILRGITRDVVIEIARDMDLVVEERLFTLFDIYNSDEAFVTGTASEIIPVVGVDGRAIGAGHPGPITQSLMEAFRHVTLSEGTPVDTFGGS